MPAFKHDPIAARLVDRELDERLARFLRSRMVPAGEVDEIIGEARKQLFEHGLPASVEEVDKLMFVIARRRAMDYFRENGPELLGERSIRAGFRKRRLPAAPQEATYWAARALEEVESFVADNPRHATALEAMRQKVAGKPLEQFATEAGVPAGTLRQWVNRFRNDACRHLPRLANKKREPP